MGAGTWTLAWLMLTAGAAAPEVTYISQRDFKIPIRIDPGSGEVDELAIALAEGEDLGGDAHHAGVELLRDIFC